MQQSIMSALLSTILLFTSLVTSFPTPNRELDRVLSSIANIRTPARATTPESTATAASPSLPSSTLAGPSPDLKLRYIGLGLGTQNYTCASPTSTPTAVGANATLYDATEAMTALNHNLGSTNNQLMERIAGQGPCMADRSDKVTGLNVLGHHYFTASGTPSFDLGALKLTPSPFLSAQKLASATAPTEACAGRDGGAAVPWLQLKDDGTSANSGELIMVYRVMTAGGALADCSQMSQQGGDNGGVITRDYSAYYYFYGN